MNQPTPEEIEAAKEKAKLEEELQSVEEAQDIAPVTTFEAPATRTTSPGQLGIFCDSGIRRRKKLYFI